jgi:hypothetical protein
MRHLTSVFASALAALTLAMGAGAQDDASSAAQMARAAEVFLATLPEEQRALATATLEDDATRDAWSNLPSAIVPRDGLRAGDMSDESRVALHAMLAASLSAQGYLKAAGIMWVDDVLNAQRGPGAPGGRDFDVGWSTENYWVTVWGDPAGERWAWGLNGHHFAASFTVVDGALSFTPMFLGAEPEVVEIGRHAGWRVLPQEANRGLELMQSLDDEQRARALLSASVDSAAFIGASRKGLEGEPRGLPGDALNEDQQALLWALIEEYVRNADHDAAGAQLDAIRADGLGAIRFSWMGPHASARERYFYRVHGPSILIDYMRERGAGAGGGSNHIHSIVRDPSNDYGEDWLGRHYDEAHARGDGPPRPR